METTVEKKAKQVMSQMGQMGQMPDSLTDKFGEKIKTGVDEFAKRAHGVESTLKTKYEDFKVGAEHGYDSAVDVVKKHPVTSILGAATIGAFVGAFIRGRRK